MKHLSVVCVIINVLACIKLSSSFQIPQRNSNMSSVGRVTAAAATTVSSAAMTAATKPLNVRIVSYNVLSSELASPDHYTTLNPEHLLASNRFPVVLEKLEAEVRQDSIICLQEVSHEWAGSLHTYFANNGYHMVTAHYGRRFNGYMGVALAWPTSRMETVAVDISRLSDKREGGWPRRAKDDEDDAITKIWMKVKSGVRNSLVNFGLADKPPSEPWELSEYRSNQLITATLKEKASGQSFCLGTYHMPCAFYAPQVMTIHSEMAAKHVQNLANGVPYILAGDFNIKPHDPMYTLLTTGTMDKDATSPDGPGYPVSKWGVEWKPTAAAMKSAYAEADGKEPDFTNYSRVHEKEPFIDTLDYIFCSQQWQVKSVLELPKDRNLAGGPFPNLDHGEPSDHLLIAADLSLSA